MRYEKPVVMDLSLRARTASGEPNGCYNGADPAGEDLCQTGGAPTSLGNQCATGPTPGGTLPPLCISGGAALLCMTGAGGGTFDTCTSGPQPI
jgi:hypothetical protein